MGDNPPNAVKKREEKSRRKDPRAWENVCKSISGLPDTEHIALIGNKYNELYTEYRDKSLQFQNLEREYNIQQREKDHLQMELTKTILTKAKLGDLCRVLQKQNKQIKEENLAKLKDEEDRRREVSTQLTEKLKEITNIMDETNSKSVALHTENVVMQTKLSELSEQFKDRDKHISQIMQEREQATATEYELQVKLLNERKAWMAEREQLLTTIDHSQQNCQILQANIDSLQQQLNIYKNQYSVFESTMVKSGEVFTDLRNEMSQLTLKLAQSENKSLEFKNKWQSSAQQLVTISDQFNKQQLSLNNEQKKVDKLQNLCRQLQTERSSYLKLLKTHGIDTKIPNDENEKEVKPQPKPASVVPTKGKATTKKEKELAQLKQEMKQLKLVNQQALNDQKAEEKKLQTEKAVEQDENVIAKDSTNTESSDNVNTSEANVPNNQCDKITLETNDEHPDNQKN